MSSLIQVACDSSIDSIFLKDFTGGLVILTLASSWCFKPLVKNANMCRT